MTPERTPDTLAVALHFASILERLGIPYVVGGSIASSVHGEPRSTQDVDFVVDVSAGQIDELINSVQPAYYVEPDTAREAVAAGTSFNAIQLESAVKVDVFVARDDAFDQERILHATRVQVGPDVSDTLSLDTAEHTVLRKLEWYRRGGEVSDRQWRDVAGIVRAHGPRLDRTGMDVWAERLGVSDLLRRVFAELEQEGSGPARAGDQG